jgi:GT2 family glycosyltransferase
VVLQAITPAIGAAVLPHGFRAPLPDGAARAGDDSPPDGAALARLENPIAALERAIAARPVPAESASLIICTRDRPTELDRCLGSLRAIEGGFDEIVIVDNGPANARTREVVARHPGVVYVAEERPGLSVARNTGIRASRGAIVAFTDDDVVVHRRWAERLRTPFADPTVMAVTGLVLPAELENAAQSVFEFDIGGFSQGFRPIRYDREFYLRMRDYGVPVWRVGAGASMAFRRSAFDAVGVFDERLGAGASGCSEDSEMWYRLVAAGHVCHYEPTAVVFHRHRPSWDGLDAQMRAYMRGHVAALFVQFWRHGDVGNLRRAFLTIPKYYCGLVRARLRGGTGPRHRLLRSEIAGVLSGLRLLPAMRRRGP